jgi:hypothetical protein
MSAKSLIWIGMFIGSTLGGYIPTLFGGSVLDVASVFGSAIGGILGIWAGYKLSHQF